MQSVRHLLILRSDWSKEAWERAEIKKEEYGKPMSRKNINLRIIFEKSLKYCETVKSLWSVRFWNTEFWYEVEILELCEECLANLEVKIVASAIWPCSRIWGLKIKNSRLFLTLLSQIVQSIELGFLTSFESFLYFGTFAKCSGTQKWLKSSQRS